MANSVLISSIFLVVLVTPGFCQQASVCKEDDGDIRVDCLIPPKPNQMNTYAFSITVGGKEITINTNVTGTKADPSFNEKTEVTPIDGGYRLRWLKHEIKEDTTFICKASEKTANVMALKDKMVACSAISVFLHSCPWCLSLLVFHVTQSWVLSAL